MSILKVARMGHPILRERARELSEEEVESDATQTLIEDMVETMHEYDGVGIAAPQVHRGVRIMVFEAQHNLRYPDTPEIPLTVAINPEIVVHTDQLLGMWEGCLSVPGIRGYVERPSKVTFSALDKNGQRFAHELEGFAAVVVQHECDHLDGFLFVDRVEDPTRLAFLEEYQKYHA